jgi:hypothetical protein
MATPTYSGKTQQLPSVSSWFGSWLGGTPTYSGAGQPVTKPSMFGGAAPAYKTAPAPTASTDAAASDDQRTCVPAQFAIVIPREAPRETCDPNQ